MIFLKAQNKQ